MNLTGRFSNGMNPVRMRKRAIALQNAGRGGDTMLAHINPREARMLKRMGGAGTVNPRTGLPEFYDDYEDYEESLDTRDSDLPSVSDSDFNTGPSSDDGWSWDTSSLNPSNWGTDQESDEGYTMSDEGHNLNNPFAKTGAEILSDSEQERLEREYHSNPANQPSYVTSGRNDGGDGSGTPEDTNIDIPDDDSHEALMTDDEYKSKVYDEALDLDETYTPYLEEGDKFYGDDPTRLKDAKSDIDTMQTHGMVDDEYTDIGLAKDALNLGIGGSKTDFNTASGAFDTLSKKNLGATAITDTGTTAGTVTADDMSKFDSAKYMNPYISNVLDSTISRMDDSRKKALMNVGAGALSRGAFGGDRHGIMEADVNKDYLRQVGDVTGTLMDRGYNRATDLFTRDSDRRLTADTGNKDRILRSDTLDADRDLTADINRENLRLGYGNLNLGAGEASGNLGVKRYGTMSNYAGDLTGMTDKDINRRYTNINALTNTGMDDRTTDRMNTRFDFGEFNRETDYPYKRLGALGSIMSGAPIKQEAPTYHSGGGKGGII